MKRGRCKECGNPYTAKRARQVYCSKDCAKAYFHRRLELRNAAKDAILFAVEFGFSKERAALGIKFVGFKSDLEAMQS